MAAAGPLTPRVTDEVGEQLTGWGKVARVETRGRTTGLPLSVAVGFVEAEGGAMLVAAGEPDADWALNLLADRRCRVTIESRTVDAVADVLPPTDAGRAVTALILKYGTPAERLGRGPVFRLRPAAA